VRAPRPADFARPTVEVARLLLGGVLEHAGAAGTVAGRIVEVEAYLARDDEASHSARGPTRRNTSMFGPPGHAYVYLCYGLHVCFNVVTAPRGTGEAVLVRALEIVEGEDLARARRRTRRRANLANGPGKLCAALDIALAADGSDLSGGALRLHLPRAPLEPAQIEAGPRVGITRSVDLPLRFRERV
jgi:DNA-3-methyladenine glycosylase